jgi:hypothetical protein
MPVQKYPDVYRDFQRRDPSGFHLEIFDNISYKSPTNMFEEPI